MSNTSAQNTAPDLRASRQDVTHDLTVRDDMQGTWANSVPTDTGSIVGKTSRLILASSALFLVWACVFPLSSAVVAEGAIISKGQNKVIQHRTGGIVAEIHAREGDPVKAGQIVMRLDPVTDQAELTRLRGRVAILDALRQRLEAEKKYTAGGEAAIPSGFSLRGLKSGNQSDNGLMTNSAAGRGATSTSNEIQLLQEQQREFEKGRGAVLAEVDGILSRMDASKRRRAGVSERIGTVGQQIGILSRQLETMRPLANLGHIPKKSVWDIEEQLLGRKGELANLRAEEGAIVNEINELSLRITQAKLTDERQTSTRLTEVIAEIAQIRDQIKAAEYAVTASDVRASVDGTMIHTKHTTIGAIAAPGEVLAQIVPKGSELSFRARVSINDITHVKLGQPARAKISALNARMYDDVPGEVSFVAADTTLEERTGLKYFDVEIKLTGDPKDPKGVSLLTPGLAGQAYIDGESRTFARYLLQPFFESLARAFKER